MDISLVASFLVWILGGFANIVTGMGGPLLCLPLLIFFVDLPVVVVMAVVAGSLSCVATAARFRRFIDWGMVPPLLLGCAPGLVLGVLCLKHAPMFWLELALGTLLAAFAVWQLAAPGPSAAGPRGGRLHLLAAGAAAGFGGGAVGVAGPPMALCAYLCGWEKNMARGVFGVFFVAQGALTTAFLLHQGMMTPEAAEHTLAAIPGMLVGTALGIPASARLPQGLFRKIMLLVVLAGGVALLCKAFLL